MLKAQPIFKIFYITIYRTTLYNYCPNNIWNLHPPGKQFNCKKMSTHIIFFGESKDDARLDLNDIQISIICAVMTHVPDPRGTGRSLNHPGFEDDPDT